MKRLLVLLLFSLLFCSCLATGGNVNWHPYVGAPIQELAVQWGRCSGSIHQLSTGTVVKTCWYNKDVLYNRIWPGYASNMFSRNILITVRNGMVESISYY